MFALQQTTVQGIVAVAGIIGTLLGALIGADRAQPRPPTPTPMPGEFNPAMRKLLDSMRAEIGVD